MAILRTAKTKNFTMVDNSLLYNKTISPPARLILITALSMKDSTEFSVKRLSRICGMGQDTVRTSVRELMSKGFVNRKRERIDGRYGKMLYDIYESPSLNPAFGNAPVSKKPAQVEPDPVLPAQAEPHDIYNSNINNIYSNKTQSINQDGQTEDQIRNQIEYDILCQTYDRRLLDDLVGVMADVMMAQTDTIEVRKGTVYPTAYVRSCLTKINALHIQQIMDKLDDTKPTIRNPRGYLLTTLINAANTMSMGYQYGDY